MNAQERIITKNKPNYTTTSYNTSIFCRKSPKNEESKAGASKALYPIFKKTAEPKSVYFNRSTESTKTTTNASSDSSNNTIHKDNKTIPKKNFFQKKNDKSDYRIFTGTAERVIKWNKVYKNFCYYEVISSIISIQESSVRLQKIMLLKDRKGPILQVLNYVNDHINIEDFHVGQMLRCVGRMVCPNTLHAVSIRAATSMEVEHLQRLCYICDHAVAKAV